MNWTYWSSYDSHGNHLPIYRSDTHRPPNVQRWKDGAWVDEPFLHNFVTDELDRGSGMVAKIAPEEVAALDPRALTDEASSG